MTSASIPRPVPGFALQQMDDDVLLYHPGLTRTVHLNDTAALIWKLCDGLRSVDDIASLLGEAYPEAASEMNVDVMTALARLVRDGVVECE
ncbi:MAG: PqqD family protein [Vicinamibacterales bacterium]